MVRIALTAMELVFLLGRLFCECGRNLSAVSRLCVRKYRRKATCLFCHQAIVKSATEFPFCGRHDPFGDRAKWRSASDGGNSFPYSAARRRRSRSRRARSKLENAYYRVPRHGRAFDVGPRKAGEAMLSKAHSATLDSIPYEGSPI